MSPRPTPEAGVQARHGPWLLAFAIALYGAVQYGDVLRLPFLQDDWTILEKVLRTPLPALLAPHELLYGWYRPWSRELHFWIHHRLFGLEPAGYHATSLVLWLSVLTAYAALARRIAGGRAAALATLGLATVGGWSGTLLWVSGAQELWMLLFGLLALLAFARGWTVLACIACAGALASKELGAVVPALAFLHAWRIERTPVARALFRALPLTVLAVAWLALHPGVRTQLAGIGHAHSPVTIPPPGAGLDLGENAIEAARDLAAPAPSGPRALDPAPLLARSVLACFNLERIPNPEGGWPAALPAGLPGLVLLLAAAFFARADPVQPGGTAADLRGFGLGWGLVALAPVAFAVSWSPYYAVLGACGVWLAVGGALARRPRLAVPAIGLVALLQPLQARTPGWEWGGHAYQRRAARYVEQLRLDLYRDHPTVPPHTRFYFAEVPQGVGVGHSWFTPAFEVWYRDTTIQAEFLSSYRAHRDTIRDLFYRFDPPSRWIEVVAGPEDIEQARIRNLTWETDHVRLALTFGRAGDWRAAAREIEKLARAFPANPDYALNLARCLDELGERDRAARWKARADSLAAGSR